MFLLFFWQIMSEGSLASSFLRAFSWLTDPAPLGFFLGVILFVFSFSNLQQHSHMGLLLELIIVEAQLPLYSSRIRLVGWLRSQQK